ncbi:hypothetical protein HOY80DRAFT_1114766 [Tuber brumale]|nr:hypothetical protein HOY80DRAFT_1114766 [Tuber brumale]
MAYFTDSASKYLPPLTLPAPTHPTPATNQNLFTPSRPTSPNAEPRGEQNSERLAEPGCVAERSEARNTMNEDGHTEGNVWPPMDFGGGRPPIYIGKMIDMKPEEGGTSWRCKIRDCLTWIPDAHIPAGRVNIQKHIDEHYSALQNIGPATEEEPMDTERDVQPLLDEIERLAKVWEDRQKEGLKDFDEINRQLIELESQRQRDRILAEKSAATDDIQRELEALTMTTETESGDEGELGTEGECHEDWYLESGAEQ